MNLPNKLTVLRIVMIPFFVVFFFGTAIPQNYLLGFVVFSVAALTDALDGNIARKRGLVTNFGKLMDPLADKLLVMAAMVCILGSGLYEMSLSRLGITSTAVHTISLVVLIIVMSRDLVVNSIRLVAAGQGKIIAADNWGKIKTVTQMVWICLVLADFAIPANIKAGFLLPLMVVEDILLVIMVMLTVGSGFNYVWQNRDLFDDA